ncbi:MAG: TPM domain-containing protein [Candidatus Absconditabacterales bacterium]|jgi:uncharacterized membrane protein
MKNLKFKKNFLTKKEKKTITDMVAQAEKTTAGEIRVVIVGNSKSFKGDNPVYAHAVEAFHKYGLGNTKDKTGVLIFLSVGERRIEILADEGISAKIEQSTWDSMVAKLIERIRSGNTCNGICEVVKQVGTLLTSHFPIQPDDKNELPNEVIVEP